MANSEKLQQLEELFNYDEKITSPFPISVLLETPSMFMNYCYDFNDRKAEDDYIDFMYKESPKYDSRVNKSYVKGLEDKAEFKEFCLDYIDHLDLNRMLVFAYHRLQQSEIGSLSSKKKQTLDALKQLMKKYCKSNAVVTFYKSSKDSKNGLPDITEISSDSILGIKRPKENFISDEQYEKYMKYFSLDDAKDIFGDHRIFSSLRMFYLDLVEDHPELTEQEKVKLLFNNKSFKNAIDSGKYILTLNYGIIDRLKNSSNGISLMEFMDTIEDFQDINFYINADQYLDENYRDEYAGRNFLVEFGEISSKLTNHFLEQDGSNIDTLITLGLINKELFEKYFSDSLDKEATLSFASSFGLVKDDELKRYCRLYSLDEQKIVVNTFNRYLQENGIKQTDYVKWPIEDEAFRRIIPKTELVSLVSSLIKSSTKNPDSTIPTSKLYMLLEDEIIDENFLKKLYLDNDISIKDVETLSNFYSDYNINTLYGFDQSTTQLVSFYKYLYEDIISKAMQEEGDKYEDKPIFVDPDEYLLKANYEFQRKLFRESSKNSFTKNRELEDELDYLILYPGVAKHLYHQGLIDVRSLKEHIDDKGEVPEKRQTTLMVLNGEISSDDLPTIVKGTSLEDNAMVLTQLYESRNITYREIIEKYLAGNISYNNLLLFGDGRDLSSCFNEDRYLALFSNAINTSNEEKIRLFSKYKRAFEVFMPGANKKKLYTKQRAELSKSNRRDKFAFYYRENVIDGKNILDLFDDSNIKSNKYLLDILADLIKTQDLKVEDCELLFKDQKGSTTKRDRLEYILSNYPIPNELKMKVLLDTYIENSEVDLENYDYLLQRCLEYASSEKSKNEGTHTSREKTEGGTKKKEQEVMPYPLRYRDIISIDPSMTSKILGSKILFHSSKYNKYIFEQMYTTKNDMNSQLTTHATYVLSDELAESLDEDLFIRDKDGNIVDFNYRTLIDAYRYGDKNDASKTLHKSRSWISQLKKKITGGHKLAQTVLEQENNMEIG